jgi:hypothetical protein
MSEPSVSSVANVVVVELLSGSRSTLPHPPVAGSTKFGAFPAAIRSPSGFPKIASPLMKRAEVNVDATVVSSLITILAGGWLPKTVSNAMAVLSALPFLTVASDRNSDLRARRLSATNGSRRFYSITSSAVARSVVGNVNPSTLAVVRLTTSSNLVGCSTGMSPGFAPRKILSTISAEPHTRLRYFCSPQHTDSALYPIISQMERAAAFVHDDTAQAKLDKLDALLAQSFTPRQDAALFAEMLSLPDDGRHPSFELAPQQRRQKTLEALTLQVGALSQSNPVLMIFEDAHWADPTSLEAFGRAVDRIRTLGVLLIVTHRPEFEPPWIGRPHVTALTINRLGEREIAALIDRVTGNKSLPTSVRQDIIERTDGIPLFVEEMTKAMLEAESEGDPRKTTAAISSPSVAVPASLHASLMARLDRLGSAKEVAQIGAVIGREFSHALLASVSRKDEPQLQSTLDRLTGAGLLFRQGLPPYATYLFKHALVQDAAYGTLLREQRRALHALVAETLESQFTEIAENQPELLARHCTEAGQIEKAAVLWGKAGQRSLQRSALVEAAEQITRALNQIATLPVTPALRREQIKLQVALITPLIHIKGYAAPETKAAAERARLLIEQAEALGEPSEDPLLLFSVLYGVWAANFVAFNGDVIRELAVQFRALAEKQGTTVPLLQANRVMGISLLHTGDIVESRKHFDSAMALYDPAEHRPLAMRFFGVDARGPSCPIALCGYSATPRLRSRTSTMH